MNELDRRSRGAHPPARARSFLAAVGLAMSLAACAGTGADGGLGQAATPGTTGAAPERGTTPPTSRPDDGSASSTRGVTKPITPDQKLMRIRGRITEGVESGCVVLIGEGGSGTWLLLRSANLRLPGGRVEVTGYVVHGLLTTCQQGRPFRVVSIRPL